MQPGTPADQAGLRAGDAIESVDGHAFHSVDSLLAYMQDGQGKPIDAGGAAQRRHAAHGGASGQAGCEPAGSWASPPCLPPCATTLCPWARRSPRPPTFCKDNSFLIVEVLQRLFTHKVAVSQLAGPVGIARMAGDAAEMKGWLPKFGLAGEISLNLGILNLMPFPILDGGMILLLLIESVIRRDISINVKERIYQAAFVVLVAFFAFIIFNDVTKLPIFTHLKP